MACKAYMKVSFELAPDLHGPMNSNTVAEKAEPD